MSRNCVWNVKKCSCKCKRHKKGLEIKRKRVYNIIVVKVIFAMTKFKI